MKPLHHYLLATSSWFLSFGIQSVTFAWLVTMVLGETAEKVGIAQMTFLAPATLLMLLGGSLADHYGGRIVALCGHLAAALAPIFLITVLVLDRFNYSSIIIFAIIIGCAQAMVTPARDGLLTLVADGRVQRRVIQVSMIQFGVQMLGFLAASFADTVGAVAILTLQLSALLAGALAYYKLKVPPTLYPAATEVRLMKRMRASVMEGFKTVRRSPPMRAVVVQTSFMGIFFMGSYIVLIPLLIREQYSGSSTELAWVNAVNGIGMVLSLLVLLRTGELKRPGRAILLAHGIGCLTLAALGLNLSFISLVMCVFSWGVCGGIAMSMSRTIMQELAPKDQRSRMMAFFSFSFLGSGPIGAIVCGYMARWFGLSTALMVAAALMLVVVLVIALTSELWKLDTAAVADSSIAVPPPDSSSL